MEEITLNLIMHSGEGRSYAMEAITAVKKGESELAINLLQKSDEEIGYAHLSQSTLMKDEIEGNISKISLLLVHAEDHLMTTIMLKELANELVDLYLKIN